MCEMVRKYWFKVAVDFSNGEFLEMYRYSGAAALTASVTEMIRGILKSNDTGLSGMVITQVPEKDVPNAFRYCVTASDEEEKEAE